MLDNIIIQLKLRTVWSWPEKIPWALERKRFLDWSEVRVGLSDFKTKILPSAT